MLLVPNADMMFSFMYNLLSCIEITISSIAQQFKNMVSYLHGDLRERRGKWIRFLNASLSNANAPTCFLNISFCKQKVCRTMTRES